MGIKAELDCNEAELEEALAAAVKEHDAAQAALDFFAFFAPAGLPLSFLAPAPAHFPEPLSSLPADEWRRLFAVLSDHGLVFLGPAELCILPCVQQISRRKMDAAAANGWIQAAVDYLTRAISKKSASRLDEINRMAWHTAIIADHAVESGAIQRLEPLLDLLDWQGRVLIDVWPDRAILSHWQGLTLCKTLKGADHHGVAIRMNNLGQAWQRLGELERAEEYLQKALALLEKRFGPRHQMVANLLGNFALLRRDQHRVDEAASYFQRALVIVEKDHGLENPLVNICVNGLGRIIKNRQGIETAAEFLAQALAKSADSSGVRNHPNIAMVFNNLGILQAQSGNRKMAGRSFAIAAKVAEKCLPAKHPMHGQIHANRNEWV